MDYWDEQGPRSWWGRHWKTVLVLVLLLGIAGFFRVGFNYGAAINEGTLRFAGNDDYYHLRVVQHVLAEGVHIERDPLLNYPVTAINPRPPLYDWHVAIGGRILEWTTGMEGPEAGAYALEWGSAFWGVLTVIPIWLIGRTVYNNRAGLWAGFLVAASPAHVQRSGFGLGDHDAFVLFFLALGFYFLIRALQLTRDDTRVASWASLRSMAEGFGTYIDHHRLGLSYAFLAGLCFTAIALAWEGFPYVSAVYAVYYGLQLLANQMRRRDSTGDVLVMVILMGTLTLLAFPYYWDMGHIHATITANAYIFAGIVFFSLVLVPTRDLPSVVVLPALAVALTAVMVVLTFVFPDIGRQVFSANGYFLQSKVYSTIAEAQRTELGVFVFSIGFMTFFLALVGSVWATLRFFKTWARDQLFLVGWGLISIYMAFAAARFVFNAAPVFAILAGWIVDKMMGWMNWRERARDFRSLRHESWAKAARSVVGTKQIAGGLFLGLTLIVPSVWFSLDAGLPSEVRATYVTNHPGDEFITGRTGAFGQGFLSNDWIQVYAWLRDEDALDGDGNPLPCVERPAHMAWWDYGFWEVALGCHPTVADNFQNGVDIAGRFLTARSEREGIHWMTVRLLEGEGRATQGVYSPQVRAVVADLNQSLADALPARYTLANMDAFHAELMDAVPTAEEAAEFYLRVAAATGDYIGYFLADVRMLPLDNPDTPSIESGSIFYAPAFLANKNPDDFVQTLYIDQSQRQYRVYNYYVDEDGNSRQRTRPVILDSTCTQYDGNLTVPSGCRQYLASSGAVLRTVDGELIDYGHNQGRGDPIQGVRLDLKAPLYETMFYRGYQGGTGSKPAAGNLHAEQPGNGLEHFRLVREEGGVRLLKFYLGAPLEGQVTFSATGEPIGGVGVFVVDEYGARHASTATDAEGRYRLLLPPSTRNDATGELQNVTVVYERNGVEIDSQGLRVTERQAMQVEPLTVTGDLAVDPVRLDLFAFLDVDRNSQYNGSVDGRATGATLKWGTFTAMVDESGHAVFDEVVPGAESLQGSLERYEFNAQFVAAQPRTTTTQNVSFVAAQIELNGTVVLQNGSHAPEGLGVTITAVDPDAEYTQNVTTPVALDGTGSFRVDLVPGGAYRIVINETRFEGGETVGYELDTTIRVEGPESADWRASMDQAFVASRVSREAETGS